MDGFGEHRRGSGEEEGNEFANRNSNIRQQGGNNRLHAAFGTHPVFT